MTNSLEVKAHDIANAAERLIKNAGKGLYNRINYPGETFRAIGNGLKNGSKTAFNFSIDTATNLLTSPQKALHTGLGLAERALNSIPFVGGFFSFLTGTAKDALTDQNYRLKFPLPHFQLV